MEIINTKINDYVQKVMPARDAQQKEMEKYASRNGFPIIGPWAGSFLRQMAYAINAQKVFEMGSGYGYSAYWFAGGMRNGGRIICTDGDENNKAKAMDFLKRGGFDAMVDFKVGNALDIIKGYDGPFDIILNDINKESYPEAFDLAIARLRQGGLFITDNVLWSGRILAAKKTKESLAILEFNRKLFGSPGLISSIVPIRDGLGMAVKL